MLGTVCFVGPRPRHLSTGQTSLTLIKTYRDEVADLLHRRRDRPRHHLP
ncbi:hypothetical protein ACWEFL_35340 [Streptomyces sp. NPDC004838]